MSHRVYMFVPGYGQHVTATTFLTSHAVRQCLAAKSIGFGVSTLSFPDIAELRNMALTIWFDRLTDISHLLFVDSVTADTPILVRRIGDIWIDFIEACELMPPSERFQRNRTYAHVGYEVLTHKGWQQPRAAMQAKVQKPILRISDERGTVCVTEDHSLFSNGNPLAGRDVNDGTPLDHVGLDAVDVPINYESPVTLEYAEVLGFFAAEGSAGSMSCGDGSAANGYFWALANKNKALLEKYAKVLESVHARRFLFIQDKCDVWKLTATAPSSLSPLYESMFYTPTLKKKVPKFILNAPKETIEAFLRGYERGDGHLDKNGMQSLTTNSMTLAAGLSFLYARVGRDIGVQGQRADKPSIVQMYERKHGQDKLKRPPGVRHIQRDDNFDGYVYDLNTDAGTFVGGVGLFLLHNSDMGFPPELVLDMLLFDEPLVGSIYPQRQLPTSWAGSGTGDTLAERRGDFMRVEGVGMGCCLIRRDCVMPMLARFPELIDTRLDLHPAKGIMQSAGATRMLRFFDKMDIPERGIVSEDLSFCIRHNMCGGQTWAAIGHKISHVGPYDYGHRYLDMTAYTLQQVPRVLPAPEEPQPKAPAEPVNVPATTKEEPEVKEPIILGNLPPATDTSPRLAPDGWC